MDASTSLIAGLGTHPSPPILIEGEDHGGLMVGAFMPGQVMSLRKLATGFGTSPMPVRATATVAELAWGFQESVVDVLVTKTIRAARELGAASIVLGGGVAANGPLRTRLAVEAQEVGVPLVVPRPGLCTDNGAMIGAAGWRRFQAGQHSGLDLESRPAFPLAAR